MTPRWSIAALLTVVAVASLVAASRPAAGTSVRRIEGPEARVGNGTARMFVEVGANDEPRALGIALTEAALTGLPARMNTTSRCWDRNADARFSHGECLGDYQSELAPPARMPALGLPFRWATVNWNPEGHLPPAPEVWSAPHFDFHFFLAEPALVHGIRTGPCAEFIHCEDSARASIPLPASHAPDGYLDVGAAVSAMGNHLVDSKDPELADPSRGFSHTFIYGAYDGRLIFLEPMISRAFLERRQPECRPLRPPRVYAVAGYYPTRYCVRHDPATATYRVTLEGMVRHPAG